MSELDKIAEEFDQFLKRNKVTLTADQRTYANLILGPINNPKLRLFFCGRMTGKTFVARQIEQFVMEKFQNERPE